MGMMSSDDYDTGTQAAAAGGVTCLVDFAIQREPDQLRSALEEWQGRADGAAHVDYGFHMAITNANEATIDDMAAIVDAGVSSFKLFMAYKGELMTRDDEMTACMERARDLGALTMVHAENGDVVDLLVKRALHAGADRRDPPRAHAPGVRRGRGDLARRAAGRVHRRVAVRRPRHLRRGGRRDPGRPAARRRRQRRDLHAVPRQHDRRPAQAGRRGLPLHLLAAAARRVQPRAAVGLRAARHPRERLHRPLPVHRRAEVARAGELQPRAQRAGGDPASPGQAVGRGRRRRADHAEPAGGPHLDDDRAPLRPGGQGRDRARQGRRHRRLRPGRAARLRHRTRRS